MPTRLAARDSRKLHIAGDTSSRDGTNVRFPRSQLPVVGRPQPERIGLQPATLSSCAIRSDALETDRSRQPDCASRNGISGTGSAQAIKIKNNDFPELQIDDTLTLKVLE